ncbi:unnamed protein product [Closterium sp. NIES-54]
MLHSQAIHAALPGDSCCTPRRFMLHSQVIHAALPGATLQQRPPSVLKLQSDVMAPYNTMQLNHIQYNAGLDFLATSPHELSRKGPPIVLLVPARSALALSGPARTVSRYPAATCTAIPPRTSCPALCSPRAAFSSRRAAPAARSPPLQPASRPCSPHAAFSSPRAAPAACSLANPTGGPVVTRASTVLPCPVVPSGSLSGLHLPTFSTNLVSNAAIQDVWVDTFIPGGQRVAICTLPRSLPSLPRSPAPPCLPCVEGRQRAAPHSSEIPPTTVPLQTLHMDADVSGVLIPWIRATHRQLREWFSRDFPVLRLHSTRGEVSRTSMIHAAAPHFLWPFAVRYAAHQLNLWPRGALSLVRDAKASKLSSRTLRCVFLGFPTDALPWQFYHPCSHRVFSSHDVTFDESVCYYRLHPHASHPFPLVPLFLAPVPLPVDPLPQQGPAPSGVSQVDPPPLVEPLEVSSDSSGPGEGDNPAADNTAATRCSPRLETPPGFPPWPSSPPPQPAAVDFGAETAGAEPGGAETEGAGSGGAATGGAGSGGATTRGAGSWASSASPPLHLLSNKNALVALALNRVHSTTSYEPPR